MKFVSWKEKKAVTTGLKVIYGADTIELAEVSLDDMRVITRMSSSPGVVTERDSGYSLMTQEILEKSFIPPMLLSL